MDNTILSRARAAWESGAVLRARRLRYKRYTFGRQWLDPCLLDNGVVRTERDYLVDNGYSPVTNNIIRQLVKTITGCFRDSIAPGSALADTIDTDALTFQEFLISGCAIQRIGASGAPRMVSPARFFIDRLTAADGTGAELMGELHDLSLTALVERFSHGDAGRMQMLRSVFRRLSADASPEAQLPRMGESPDDALTFDSSSRAATLRVFEIWSRECRRMLRVHDPADGSLTLVAADAEKRLRAANRKRERRGEALMQWRLCVDARWVCRFMTTDGRVLDTITAPRHPYALCFYPIVMKYYAKHNRKLLHGGRRDMADKAPPSRYKCMRSSV